MDKTDARKASDFVCLCQKVRNCGFAAGVAASLKGGKESDNGWPTRVFYVQSYSVRMFESTDFAAFEQYCETLCNEMVALRDRLMQGGKT